MYVPPPPGYAIATGFATGLAFGAGVAVANSLWGGFNWNTHDVNINVNHYNNINVNNQINVNSSTTNWNRNTNVNRNVNNTNVNRNVNNNLGSAQHDAYRGRDDAARAQAQQTLQNRTGQNLSGSASQRVQGIHQGGTQNADLQNRAQNANRDNALRGAGDGSTARQDTQRGEASRNAAANRSSNGGLGANGGGQQRTGASLSANGGGVERGGGGGAGGGRLGGGGGERPLGRNR